MRVLIKQLAIVTLALGAGCAGHHPGSGPTPGAPQRNRISIIEIQEAMAQGTGNVYDLIQRVHPEWLRSLNNVNGFPVQPNVYMDIHLMGTLTVLSQMNLSGLTGIRYLSPSEAQGELGLDNLGGAIVLTTR
ncbi:MAG TPA: hypothetical protein VGI92_01845 [Gemmatimonadales bacterium]